MKSTRIVDNHINMKISKIIRIITVAPFMALLLLGTLFLAKPEMFDGWPNFLIVLVCLMILPLLSYPLQPLAPHFKNKGREGQRNFAILMSVVGYVLGIISGYVFGFPNGLFVILYTYLLSGVFILVFNKAFKLRASGHACGVAGPIAALVYYIGPIALIGLALLAAVYMVSLHMKRHTLLDLILGTIIPVVALLLSLIFIG